MPRTAYPRSNSRGQMVNMMETYNTTPSSTEYDKPNSQLDNRRVLNLSKEKMENLKSPVWLKLDSMIETLDNYRNNMSGQRVPNFQKQFIMRKRKERAENERKILE